MCGAHNCRMLDQGLNHTEDADADSSFAISPLAPPPARARGALDASMFAALPAPERLSALRQTLDGRIVFTHGFGVEGQLIFHWLCERGLDIDVVTLDTGRLFPETYALWAETEQRYGRRIRAIYPNQQALEALVDRQGIDGFYDSKDAREACCGVRKTRPLDRALKGAQAWITGVRGDQTAVRHEAGVIGFDESRGLMKFNPLFDWTREAVLAEVAAVRVPVNALHAKGFASIGCAPCTRAISSRRARAQRPLVVGERQLPRMRAASAAAGSARPVIRGPQSLFTSPWRGEVDRLSEARAVGWG